MQRIGNIISVLSSRTAFIALVLAFLVHNFEEAITICRYPVENPFSIFQPPSCEQFLVSVSILSVAVLIVSGIAMRTKKQLLYNFISTGIAASLLLNVFVPHLLVALFTLHYTPGLVSAMMLNFPVSLWLLINNRPRFNSNKQFYRYILYFLVIAYLVFALSIGLAMYLTRI